MKVAALEEDEAGCTAGKMQVASLQPMEWNRLIEWTYSEGWGELAWGC